MFLSFGVESQQITNAIPLRIASVHLCFDDTSLFQFYRGMIVMTMNGAFNKMRLQTHVGSSSCEIRYRLLGYLLIVRVFSKRNRYLDSTILTFLLLV
jgi:hypothetical protein